MSSWSSSATRSVSWSANFTFASGTDWSTARSWLRSAGCSPGNTGEPSWSAQRRCSVGTERPDAANGRHGDASVAQGGQC